MHTNYRDSQAWKDEGLLLSFASNEASKIFDATLSQYVGWFDDPALGNLDGTLKQLQKCDPRFVMGQVLSNGLELIGTGRTTRLDKEFNEDIKKMCDNAATVDLTQREKKHVAAVQQFAHGFLEKAAEIWEDILVTHPTDMLAIKFAHDTHFYLGQQHQVRDDIARVLPSWKPTIPLYSYLFGMLAFGQVENNFYDKAMQSAKKGLEMNPRDGWATHAVAHVLEMSGKQDEGIDYMLSTMDNWTFCKMLACHIWWHVGLYHIEKGDFEAALEVYDTEMAKRAVSGTMLDVVDVTSYLYRLELEGINVNGRWTQAMELCEPHLKDHITVFNDAHFLMACLGSKNKHNTNVLLDSAFEFMKGGQGDNQQRMETFGMTLMKSMVAYSDGRYEEAFDLLSPIRYKLVGMGGSNAQRDVFDQLLIASAMKSSNKHYQKYAKLLLAERKALRENSPMTDRLIARALVLHES